MNVNKKEYVNHPFILSPDELQKLCDYLKTFTSTLIIVGVCADGLKREFDSLEDFVQFENTPKKDIKEVGLNAWSEDYTTKIHLSFSKRGNPSVLVNFRGEESDAVKLDDFLSERFTAIKPWYSFLAKEDFLSGLITLLLQSVIVMVFIIFLWKSLPLFQISFTWQIAIVVVISMVLNGLLTILRKVYFPVGVFLIGQGVKRYEDKDRIRTLIIVGFIINLIAGIVIMLISK